MSPVVQKLEALDREAAIKEPVMAGCSGSRDRPERQLFSLTPTRESRPSFVQCNGP